MNKFDLMEGVKVLVHFDGHVLHGEVVRPRFWGHTNQLTVSYTCEPVKYTEHYSRKTGKQYGGSGDKRIRASFLTLPTD